MAVREEKIVLEPMDIVWGSREKTKITTVADVASSLSGKFFKHHGPRDEVKYQVWFDVGGVSVAPTLLAGYTYAEVDIAVNATAAQVATALEAILSALPEFNNSVLGADIISENSEPGASTLSADGTAPTAFTFVRQRISVGRDLGGTSGGIELSFEANMVDVKADQTGEQILDQITNATNLNLSMTLQELTSENWQLLLGKVMGELVTSGPDTFVGLGESKRFKNMSQYCLEMMMRPINALDDKRNYHFWKIYPLIESVNHSGTDLANMTATWRPLRDTTRSKTYNLFLQGDGTAETFAQL